MDEKLKKALDFANYNHTLFNQKKIIYQDFLDNCVIYYNAGKFSVDKNLIVYVSSYNKKELLLLDDNNIPIKIEDSKVFHKLIKGTYEKQLKIYYEKYEKLVANKTVQGLIDE